MKNSRIVVWSLIVFAIASCIGWIVTSIQLYEAHARMNEIHYSLTLLQEKDKERQGEMIDIKNNYSFLEARVRAQGQRKTGGSIVTIRNH